MNMIDNGEPDRKCQTCDGSGEQLVFDESAGTTVQPYVQPCEDCGGTGVKPEYQDRKSKKEPLIEWCEMGEIADAMPLKRVEGDGCVGVRAFMHSATVVYVVGMTNGMPDESYEAALRTATYVADAHRHSARLSAIDPGPTFIVDRDNSLVLSVIWE